jgi:DNA recombination protein RmuC
MLVVLLARKNTPAQIDARLLQLPEAITRLEARVEATDLHLGDSLSRMRTEANESAQQARDASTKAFSELRTEITSTVNTLGATLNKGLGDFRTDNTANANALRAAVNEQLDALARRLVASAGEAAQQQIDLRESLNQKFSDLSTSNAQSLAKMSEDNEKKLEQMRETVGETLQKTLHTRLTESFGLVTEQLGKVQTGLGEMKELATGVGDLKRVLSNVRARGIMGEFLLGQQIEQIFSPEQYEKNSKIKPRTRETVEYALKIPHENGEFSLLAIDSKFPNEDWERLEAAYANGDSAEIKSLGRAFETAIRTQAKLICDKYIDPPKTLPHAIMYLPTENLYAEVMRRPGLHSELQTKCRVTIVGPSTFMAILTSFQMGFRTLAIQKNVDKIGGVLTSAKKEFGKFGGLLEKVEGQVNTVQKTLHAIGDQTKKINETFENVSRLDSGDKPAQLALEDIVSIAPTLAAESEEPEF